MKQRTIHFMCNYFYRSLRVILRIYEQNCIEKLSRTASFLATSTVWWLLEMSGFYTKLYICTLALSLSFNGTILSDDATTNVQPSKPTLELLDRIEAVVGTGGGAIEIITSSDVIRRGFDGNNYTTQDLINEVLLDGLGEKLKIPVEDKDIAGYLRKIGMSEDQLKEIADHWGYANIDEFYKTFKRMYRAGQALGWQVQSALILSEDIVQEYYKAHPIMRETIYVIETSFVPLAGRKTKEEQLHDLQEYATDKKELPIVWDMPAHIKKSEVPAINEFLLRLPENEIFIKQVSDGFDLFRMKAIEPEHAVSFEERRQEIMNTLRMQKHQEAVGDILEKVRKDAMILMPTFKQYPATIF